MNRLLFLSVFFLSCLFVNTAKATVIQGPVTYGDYEYLLLSSNTWDGAKTEAFNLGGNLATITNATQNQFIVDTFFSGPSNPAGRIPGNLWIGLKYDSGAFVWVSGAPVTFTNWNLGEPNGPFGGEVVEMSMFTPNLGTWNDRGDGSDFPHYGVVELPKTVPEPSTLLLFSVGCAGILGSYGRVRKHRV